MRNTIIAGIRTGVQRLIVLGLAAAGAWLATRNISIDFSGLEIWLFTVVDVLLTAGVTAALNWLEKRAPWLTSFMSLGTATSAPQYEKANPEIPKAA